MHQDYLLEINVGSLCNFRCRYCFENGDNHLYIPTEITHDVINNFARYSKWLYYTKCKGDNLHLLFYGGEPMAQYDKIKYAIERTKGVFCSYTIITNGSFTEQYKDQILRLRESMKPATLGFASSYDFTMQNEMRGDNTYNMVRDSIRWLYKNGMCHKCITVFSMRNFHRIDEIFFDFVELHKECPTLRLAFNIDRYGNIPEDFDDTNIVKALQRVKDYIDVNPEIKPYFTFNTDRSEHKAMRSLPLCFYAGILGGMTHNGNVYPSYEFEATAPSEEVRKMLYLGNISEDFGSIERRRQEVLDALNQYSHPEECINCNVPCRGHPWAFFDGNWGSWYNIPSKGYCRIQKLIWEYLQ